MKHIKSYSLLALTLVIMACSGLIPQPPPTPEPKIALEASATPVKINVQTLEPTAKYLSVSPTAVNPIANPTQELPKMPPAASLEVTPLVPPPSGSAGMVRGNAFPDRTELQVETGKLAKVSLLIVGNLPSPCNLLQVDMLAPDKDNRIRVEVYSLLDPNKMCAQVLVPFEQQVVLGSLPAGKYSVWVNGLKVGEFDG